MTYGHHPTCGCPVCDENHVNEILDAKNAEIDKLRLENINRLSSENRANKRAQAAWGVVTAARRLAAVDRRGTFRGDGIQLRDLDAALATLNASLEPSVCSTEEKDG